MEKVTKEEAVECVKKLLKYLGEDPEREGLKETPLRIINSYNDLYKGYKEDPKEILKACFTADSDEMILLSNIEMYSTCEHHLLPFLGKCHIAYIPGKKILGISKLSRLMEVYSRRLQIQEKLTHQIATTLYEEISAQGVAVLIEAQHLCMTCRGVKKQNSIMSTTSMLGLFQSDHNLRTDFFRLIERQAR